MVLMCTNIYYILAFNQLCIIKLSDGTVWLRQLQLGCGVIRSVFVLAVHFHSQIKKVKHCVYNMCSELSYDSKHKCDV